eukprot:3591825-Prorocentrum_lima.AAC.1
MDGRFTRINRKSGNPGVWPELGLSLSVTKRAELDQAFQLSGRGVAFTPRSRTLFHAIPSCS